MSRDGGRQHSPASARHQRETVEREGEGDRGEREGERGEGRAQNTTFNEWALLLSYI